MLDSLLTAELHYGNSAAEHGISFDNGRVALDSTGQVRLFRAGEEIDDLDNFGGVGDEITFNPLATGGAHDITTGGEFMLPDGLHHGFLQLRMDPPTSSTPYAIHLRYFVYEETPGEPIGVFFQQVPEPSVAALVLVGVFIATACRRRKSSRGE